LNIPEKEKIFRDPIYGYISIPQTYCSDFIDTEIFQRLRRIEQTSMRILYPSAHHDRFAHSLGVFYLGRLTFQYLRKNSEGFFPEVNKEIWDNYQSTFEIACLMHDCGHSPFSHTFEHYYLYKRGKEIKDKIASFYNCETSFKDEFDSASPADHEKISALLLLEIFYSKVISNQANPELAARMIMGCKYENTTDPIKKFENKLISLLNGSGIDVDSLDYIQRDSWASGVSNVDIDYHRLLSSIMIKPDKYKNPQIVFKKSVLSVIENISLGRNFLYKWVYSHHKVNYEQYLLSEIVNWINLETNYTFCDKAFSYESFFDSQTLNGDMSFYLTSDDDIIHFIKKYKNSNPKIEEYLSRKYKYKALWKTYFEFHEAFFKDVNSKNRMSIFTKIENGSLNKMFGENNLLSLKVQPKLKSINQNDFFIDINGTLIDASKATRLVPENLDYFILYVSKDLLSQKDFIIEELLKLQS
jgi:HD superfamily phosphohydrolase